MYIVEYTDIRRGIQRKFVGVLQIYGHLDSPSSYPLTLIDTEYHAKTSFEYEMQDF